MSCTVWVVWFEVCTCALDPCWLSYIFRPTLKFDVSEACGRSRVNLYIKFLPLSPWKVPFSHSECWLLPALSISEITVLMPCKFSFGKNWPMVDPVIGSKVKRFQGPRGWSRFCFLKLQSFLDGVEGRDVAGLWRRECPKCSLDFLFSWGDQVTNSLTRSAPKRKIGYKLRFGMVTANPVQWCMLYSCYDLDKILCTYTYAYMWILLIVNMLAILVIDTLQLTSCLDFIGNHGRSILPISSIWGLQCHPVFGLQGAHPGFWLFDPSWFVSLHLGLGICASKSWHLDTMGVHCRLATYRGWAGKGLALWELGTL